MKKWKAMTKTEKKIVLFSVLIVVEIVMVAILGSCFVRRLIEHLTKYIDSFHTYAYAI